MSRRVAVILSGVVALIPTAGIASPTTVPDAAARVRAAIPAIEAYRADRGTYAGLTLAKIRAYDRGVRSISVRRATRTGYCIQSTIRGPVVHYDGPGGPARRGRCGVRGAVVPSPPRRQPPEPVGDAAEAQSRLRAAVPAIEAYGADNDGYVGLSLAGINGYDYGVGGITIAWATRDEYCTEATVGEETYHHHGPANPVAAGACPPPP